MAQHDAGSRPWTFWFFAAFFVLFVIFLYGPMFVVYILSFQGEDGGLTFPLAGVSTHWFHELVDPNARSGDFDRPWRRGIAANRRAVGRCRTGVPPQLHGISDHFLHRDRQPDHARPVRWSRDQRVVQRTRLGNRLDTSGLGAQLTWTLPFGLLIMFAVLGRFNRAYEEAAKDLGASAWQRMREVTLPILLPGIIGVALFGFTLSYDEFPRTVLTSGSENTLPIEIWTMTTNVTSPALYAVGTVTTVVSFVVIGTALGSIALIQRRRRSSRGDPT
jgi:putative spermidine/putrescine transport system permease protein